MPSLRERLTRIFRPVRRAVLARRRLLAAALTAVAVGAGVQAAIAPPPAAISVLVAARDLPSGVMIGADDLSEVAFAPESVPTGLAADVVGRTLAAPLRRGEPVTDLRLLGPALTDGYPGLIAVPLRLPDAGMVDLLEVGDLIDLVAADPQGGDPQLIATGVPVLAIPEPATSDPGATGLSGRLVVVGAAETDVTRIADAALRYFVTFAYSR